MQLKLSISALVVGIAYIVSPAAADSQKEQDDFIGSCSNPTLSGTTLRADCRQNNGNLIDASIDLNQCVFNNGGGLFCQFNGGYGGSCSGCTLGGTTLCCNCKNRSGQNQATCLDLNQCLTNSNGELTC